MANFDRATYSLSLFTSGTATNTAVVVPDVDLTGKVTTLDDLSLGGTATELLADDSILGGRGVAWFYVLNDEVRITGSSLFQMVGSENDDIIDLTGPNGFDGYSPGLLDAEGGLGDDVFWLGGSGGSSSVVGDLGFGTGLTGGDDQIIGALSQDIITGDFLQADGGRNIGGNDDLRAAGSSGDNLIGDVAVMGSGQVTGGADTIRGDDGADTLTGDVANFNLTGDAIILSGDDEIHGGGDSDKIYGDSVGDAISLNGFNLILDGGDDLLFGDEGDDEIYGDIETFQAPNSGSGFQGGDDTINGGAGDDSLWGDFATNSANPQVPVTRGADTFVFDVLGFGDDTIFDFVSGEDTIDLSSLGVTQGDLDDSNPLGTVNNADTRATVSGGDLVITPTGNAADGTITVVDVTSLVVTDFNFA